MPRIIQSAADTSQYNHDPYYDQGNEQAAEIMRNAIKSKFSVAPKMLSAGISNGSEKVMNPNKKTGIFESLGNFLGLDKLKDSISNPENQMTQEDWDQTLHPFTSPDELKKMRSLGQISMGNSVTDNINPSEPDYPQPEPYAPEDSGNSTNEMTPDSMSVGRGITLPSATLRRKDNSPIRLKTKSKSYVA